MGCFGMFPGRLGMALGLGGFLAAVVVIALAVMFSRRPVTLRGVFVMLGSLRMSFPGHAILLIDVATAIKPVKLAAVPLSGIDCHACSHQKRLTPLGLITR
jgi:hypothetical protein